MNEIMIPTWVDGQLQPYEKLAAHREGLRHKAVSVFLFAGSETLLQQRASGKYHSGGLWANACCTHPSWDEEPEVCAHRRLEEELGITGLTLSFQGQIEYRADVGGGLIEHEVVEVFAAKTTKDLSITPNPDEVMATRWIDIEALTAEVTNTPASYTQWLHIYLGQHREMILA